MMESPNAHIPSSPARRPDHPPRRENMNVNGTSGSSSALLQHEIDMWSSLAAKTKISRKQMQEDADAILMANAISKLRDLQKEITDTDWMFDSSYS